MNRTSLVETLETFYHCSHLPISAFDSEGQQLHSFGYSNEIEDIIKTHLTPKTQNELSKKLLIAKLIHHKFNDILCITLCRINPEDSKQGFFIIGPYTHANHKKLPLVFKPLHCMTYITGLLYDIIKTPSQIEDDEYSYHVTKAKNYIEAHYTEPITLQELADYLSINKSYFCTIFKKVTKQSFCTYTNHVRIEKSKLLLQNTTDSIIDIALSTGFSSSSYFNNTFKKIVGITPLEYRQDKQKNSQSQL